MVKSQADEIAEQEAYENELLRRYESHLYLTRADRLQARRIIKARAERGIQTLRQWHS